mmetsp:Transcript_6350/g.7683  ORF Transcript_6350/g.7683 Transcript_6350/m.7683 type:complete len:516 (-) Transcript_6350:983-2530(-)|eukprot:CAMPEP_0204837916 /NCGR_PEP_ID=MMETSP1346-20131115/29324_1 /ASSEMBLY_ACC=CAM_ASM_000771 /TAXON_ID=215587 /ORGANISM="Aplanochytrium stocchinoi, Strain GSBS06" /LENGTH=515 /DNA_ID=CAMNT_0051973647 /DNA_START=123 /DNA_END=1670 /DNA_ORIENTATION=-
MASAAFALRNSGISIKSILTPATAPRKTKIVCTLGPSTVTEDKLVELIDAGMNVARFNFSHGDHKFHANTLMNLKSALKRRPSKMVAVMLDTKGVEILTGELADNRSEICLKKNQTFEIFTDKTILGDESKVGCTYKGLTSTVEVGATIIADGEIFMKVVEIKKNPESVVVELQNSGVLGANKTLNLPEYEVDLPTITEKDRRDLQDFAIRYSVDFVALSFARCADDIRQCRDILQHGGKHIQIVAKIESRKGLENFDEILMETDGIMVARGDLGLELAPEKVFLAQKMMIRKCNIAGKFVITATQMLESMISHPRPTRAESTDVANAVLDGTDCVMLSAETSRGLYPIETVNIMSSICREAEGAINYDKLYLAVRNTVNGERRSYLTTPEAIASSAVKTCIDMGAKMLVVLTETGRTPRLVAKYRPKIPILVLTASASIARQCEGTLRGTKAEVMGSMMGTHSILMRAAEQGKKLGWVKPGDFLVAVHGMMEAVTGSSNMLKVLEIPDNQEDDL